MSEQNSKTLSISFRVDAGVVQHNNRNFIAKNVDAERVSDNIIYTQHDIREMYNELFGQALAEYNARQTQPSRRIQDYYEHIKGNSKIKPFYEIVVQFGDIESCGQKSGKWEKAKLMLDDYMRSFEKRNPNLKVFNAVMHLDEATPHLHIDFIPIAHKAKNGLSIKVSMKGALQEQGFTSSNRMQNEWAAWAESEQKAMTEILRKHDLSRNVKDVRREHLAVEDYKQFAAQKEEIRKTNEHINALKKKNAADLTPDEIELILNQNDYLRSEVVKRGDAIATLLRKVGSKFVPLEIFSDDKLQYVAAELEKANVPFVEERNVLYIPEYAKKTAAALSASYNPTVERSGNGVRYRIRLEIDRLVYSSKNLDDLYDKLKERGYQIKNGKHIAVKPTFAERFVRLKSLGELYLPNNLERRIRDRDKFPNIVRERIAAANQIEKQFHITVLNIMTEVKQFRLEPKKFKPKKIYTFQNDANINYLSEQLLTIGEFNFSSKEQICSKADELKNSIDGKTARLKELSDEIPTLKSDIAQLRHLFSVGVKSSKPDAMEQVKIAAAREIAEKRGVKSEEDIAELEQKLKRLQGEVNSVKGELSDEQLRLKRVSDLITAYENIVEGNYIDNLIRTQKDKARGAETRS